ncbi:MAG: sodium:proton antiporter NhaD [Bacteroidales bacterium OttesenSCG-928-I14]|jgi:Na+/H+ antiporter NhaD/arsenite permease-like protein|nr:sodium:proton antiporter NhaD [Bacteroidales bacterium OttesenSCG-928-I14]
MENILCIHKTAMALLLAVSLWIFFSLGNCCSFSVYKDFLTYCEYHSNNNFTYWLVHNLLIEYLGKTSEVLFFLIGTMAIVEIINVYGGFRLIINRIHTTKKVSFIWIIGFLTFGISAILDNITTSIIMTTLLRKLIVNKKDRWLFGSVIILAANAGGIWSPIGDITTVMLWLAEKINSNYLIANTFLPALTSMTIPIGILSFTMDSSIIYLKTIENEIKFPKKINNFVFFLGIGILLFVPLFKKITNLPPYFGMLGGFSILWIVSNFIYQNNKHNCSLSIHNILKRVDIHNILFFFGILMAINALQSYGILDLLSAFLDKIFIKESNKYYIISIIIGVFSSIIDNIPLVAGTIEMYKAIPNNHYFWTFLAYTTGSGGSILLIGSAAGVAVMGMEDINFIWYSKKISWIVLIGYLSGCFVYIFQQILI